MATSGSLLERVLLQELIQEPTCPNPDYTGQGTSGYEYLFHSDKAWRLDLVWFDGAVAVEIDGGVWKRSGGEKCLYCGETPKGGHNTGAGYIKQLEKQNAAMLYGWAILRFTSDDIMGQGVVKVVEEIRTLVDLRRVACLEPVYPDRPSETKRRKAAK